MRVVAAAADDAAPGIDPHEMRVLVTHYHWMRGAKVPSYTRPQLARLFQVSADSTSRDFGSDTQARRLAVALASVGDDTFADTIKRQSHTVQYAVACSITDLFFQYGLRYSKTKELLRPHT